jgi:hypothetical protein
MAKSFLDTTGLTSVWAKCKALINTKVASISAGTNVTITGTATNPVISVTGIEIPEKFTTTDTASGSIGTSVTGLDFNNVSPVVSGSVFSVNDIVIFSNGNEGQVVAYNSGTGKYDAVIVYIPSATSWGNIDGTLANQTDLKSVLDGKQKSLTAGANIELDASGNISAVDSPTEIDSESLLITGSGFNLTVEAGSISTDAINIICV